MNDKSRQLPNADAADSPEREPEPRPRRKFSLAEAIGREGADLLKGASPVTLKRQAELEIEQVLQQRLDDREGALRVVLVRRVRESEALLAANYSEPVAALAREAEGVLSSETRLERFVRVVDAEWGRMYSERPFFERQGMPPHRQDPYTLASVRETLTRLLERLGRDPENG